MRMVTVGLSDRSEEVSADVQIERDRHELGIPEIIVFIFIDAFEPGVELLLIQFVIPSACFRNVFAGEAITQNFESRVTGVRNEIESLAVERIQKTGRVTDQSPTVTHRLGGIVGHVR